MTTKQPPGTAAHPDGAACPLGVGDGQRAR
jgi:hypothetical protein